MRIVATLVFLLAATAAARADGGLDRAVKLFEQGKFREALEAADRVGASDASYPRARYLTGEIHLALGEADAAEEAFRTALEKKPHSVPLLVGMGRALLALRRPADAEKPLREAAAADGSSARALAFLGIARLRASEGKKGKKELKAGLKLGIKDPEVVRAVVVEEMRDEDLAAAKRAAHAFAAARKTHPMGPFLMGLIDEKDKDYGAAIDAYLEAIRRDDTFLDAHKNLAILCIAQNPLYTNRKRTRLALEHFQRYVDLGGKDKTVIAIYDNLKQLFAQRKR